MSVSYSPDSSFSAIMSGLTALPHSTSMKSACLPQARMVSANRWENAPLMHARALFLTMLLPMMSNQRVPEEVVTVGLQSLASSKYLVSLAVIPAYSSENSLLLCPMRGWVCSWSISWLTSVGPGMSSFLCILLSHPTIKFFRGIFKVVVPFLLYPPIFLFMFFTSRQTVIARRTKRIMVNCRLFSFDIPNIRLTLTALCL